MVLGARLRRGGLAGTARVPGQRCGAARAVPSLRGLGCKAG